MVDVRSRRCLEKGCEHQPSYSASGSSPEYCSVHKKAGMIDVKNRKGITAKSGVQACDKI